MILFVENRITSSGNAEVKVADGCYDAYTVDRCISCILHTCRVFNIDGTKRVLIKQGVYEI